MFPFEMDSIVGAGISPGNLATGSTFGATHRFGIGELLWAALALVGTISAVALPRFDANANPPVSTPRLLPHRYQSFGLRCTPLQRFRLDELTPLDCSPEDGVME
ncbi:hypothetical protein JF729_08815 [Mycobacterium intracellulare]|uniref:hypothetical protein n=1 Tax=Mycobacterium intracellulare TaxID=1767 RepID=UPI001CD92D87|nr:hypothetical protein [Mycobacterium intracellulare]MCA2247889.1 hypothetical protein [Mycobacterium intracellulare]